MLDFFGTVLSLGDEVAFMEPRYRNMTMGKIVKFTPQKILIEWNNPLYTHVPTKTFLATSSQVIKKPS